MDFREGMLGVVVVALALTGALFVSYFAGVESTEEEYVAYDYLSDVSGLFEYDQSPTFIEYDPSTNYTGYYSEEYINDYGKFWPEDQVDYVKNVNPTTQATRANNYRIYGLNEIGATTTIDLSDVVPDDDITTHNMGIRYVYNISGDKVDWIGSNTAGTTAAVYMKDLLTDLGLDDSYSNVYISLGNEINWDDTPTEDFWGVKELVLNSILILPYSNYYLYIANPSTDLSEYENLDIKITKPYLSFIVDMNKWTVKCYRTADYSGTPAIYSADALAVCFGPAVREGSYDHLDLDVDFTYTPVSYNDPTYLDPNYGVAMKD